MGLYESIQRNINESTSEIDVKAQDGILDLINSISGLEGTKVDNRIELGNNYYISCVADEDKVEITLALNNEVIHSEKIDFHSFIERLTQRR